MPFDNGWLDYRLERRRGRTISIHVGRDGVRVRAPRWARLTEIESFLKEKQTWIKRREAELVAQPRGFNWRDGVRVAFFNKNLLICVRYVNSAKTDLPECHDEMLLVPMRVDGDEIALQAQIVAWIRATGIEYFRERAAGFAAQIGYPVPKVAFSNARGRWGSCSRKSGVRLSWRLALLPPRLADYVIAHEIAHLVHMDHSPRFWAVVERLYPNCKAARRELRDYEKSLPR